jgi:hypothetical protein
MSTIRLKLTISNLFSDVDLSKGVMASLLHDFYRTFPLAFPYKSMKSLLRGLQWPSSYAFLGNYPVEEDSTGWADNLNGVANDGTNWFFANNDEDPPRLWKFPITHDLAVHVNADDLGPGINWNDRPSSLSDYEHFGDIDCFEGRIYVPLQFGSPRKVARFDAKTLSFLGVGNLEKGDGSWCAINPLNGLLYESPFYELEDPPSQLKLRVYQRHESGNDFSLSLLGEFPLFTITGSPISLRRIQGGAFSRRGHLYLVSDSGNDSAGIHGFDMITGRHVKHLPVSYELGTDVGEELQGLTIWDLKGNSAPHIEGQVHAILLENDGIDSDDLIFKHWGVSEEDREKI